MLPFVKRLALQIRQDLPAHVEVDDLIANGMLGLIGVVAPTSSRGRRKMLRINCQVQRCRAQLWALKKARRTSRLRRRQQDAQRQKPIDLPPTAR